MPIPVLNQQSQLVGLVSLAMITDKMLDNDDISVEALSKYQVKDVMQTDFPKVNFTDAELETQLHLLVDNNFIPIVDDDDVFQGMITRREWFKAFNYLAHTFDDHYMVIKKNQILRLEANDE